MALDLVSKIRELADQGESEAGAWVVTLDKAIETGNKAALQKIEGGLLEDVRDKFSLVNEREHTELGRLRDDRHVCAHPAFTDVDKVFSPTPEPG